MFGIDVYMMQFSTFGSRGKHAANASVAATAYGTGQSGAEDGVACVALFGSMAARAAFEEPGRNGFQS